MNSPWDQVLQVTNKMPVFIIEHLSRVNTRIESCTKQSLKELDVFKKFLGDLHTIGVTYERSIFHMCEDFQHMMKEHLQDEKLAQYFQLVINNVLKYGDRIQKQFEAIREMRRHLSQRQEDFTNQTIEVRESIANSLEKFKAKNFEFDDRYRKYVRTLYLTTSQSSFITNSRSNTTPEFSGSMIVQNSEDSVSKCFEELESEFKQNLDFLRTSLRDNTEKENVIKSEVRTSTVSLIKLLVPDYSEELDAKIMSLEDHMDSFKNNFEELKKDSILEFNKIISLASYNLRFVPYKHLTKIDSAVDQNHLQNLLQKLNTCAKFVSPKIKIYVEILLDTLYSTAFDFTKEIWEEVSYLLNNQSTKEYLVCSLMFKKLQLLGERPTANINIKDEQIRNFVHISGFLMANCSSLHEGNLEIMLSYLKFSLTIFNRKKDCLTENFAKFPLMQSGEFWKKLHSYLTHEFINSSNFDPLSLNNSTSSTLVGSLKTIVGNIKQNYAENKNRSSLASIKAYEETTYFLFSIKLSLDKLSTVLLELSVQAGVGIDMLRGILQRYQDSSFMSMAEPLTSHSKDVYLMKKWSNCKSKVSKISLCLKTIVTFLDSPADIMRTVSISRQAYIDRRSILSRVLVERDLSAYPLLRKKIYLLSLNHEFESCDLLTDLNQSADNVIALDVKRTFCESQYFDPKGLQLILQNISHHEAGNFAYYQGLNYLANYFYILFEGDAMLTYRYMLSLLHKYFARYIATDLSNLKQIFFVLKKTIRQFVPVVSNYLEKELKLDMDIVFASWCLTLFTTVTQYEPKSALLAEIIDIFIGEGWVGFVKVVLVIIKTLQNKLLKNSYEELLVFFTDLAKTNFRDVVAEHEASRLSGRARRKDPRFSHIEENMSTEIAPMKIQPTVQNFSFKRKIRMFKAIDKHLIEMYEAEYAAIKRKMDDFWITMEAGLRQ